MLIAGLKISQMQQNTIADEVCVCAALTLLGSCFLSYVSMRTEKHSATYEKIADYLFLSGLVALFIAVLIFALDII